uniref:Uncharacterized protein n=1 Tax=Timema bartmani TaxID=61472 RepID=A0A7R9F4D8_9NEOP|nr:unnamed protein product [Timema bartmani]
MQNSFNDKPENIKLKPVAHDVRRLPRTLTSRTLSRHEEDQDSAQQEMVSCGTMGAVADILGGQWEQRQTSWEEMAYHCRIEVQLLRKRPLMKLCLLTLYKIILASDIKGDLCPLNPPLPVPFISAIALIVPQSKFPGAPLLPLKPIEQHTRACRVLRKKPRDGGHLRKVENVVSLAVRYCGFIVILIDASSTRLDGSLFLQSKARNVSPSPDL